MKKNPAHLQFLEALRNAPRETIHGVVYPSGVGASKSKGDECWHMTFELAAYERGDGEVRNEKLQVRKDIREDELDSYQQRLPHYSLVSLSVGLIEDSSFAGGGPQAWLDEILEEVPKSGALSRIAEELRKPVTTHDAQFGTFTLNRNINWHEAATIWGTGKVRLVLSHEDDGESFPQSSLENARTLWNNSIRWEEQVRQCMTQQLLGIKNESWLAEGEAELSADEFLARVTLETISVNPAGSFEFWYEDGDLFWGHSIMVSGSLEGGVDTADIHG